MTSPSTPSTTRLYLVRHGATQLTAEDRFSGGVGVELSDNGRRQVARLAARLAHEAISAVYCQPVSRTMGRPRSSRSRTVTRSCTATGCARSAMAAGKGSRGGGRVAVRRGVRGLGGRPVYVRSRRRRGGRRRLPRALPVVREIVVSHRARILVVSTRQPSAFSSRSLLGFDPRGYRDRLDQSPACLNVVDFCDPVRARLMLFNDTSHYLNRPAPAGAEPVELVGRAASGSCVRTVAPPPLPRRCLETDQSPKRSGSWHHRSGTSSRRLLGGGRHENSSSRRSDGLRSQDDRA